MICKTLHILPNDPLFQSLEPLQLVWVLDNLQEDVKLEQSMMRKHLKKQGLDISEVESDESSVQDIIQFMKEQDLAR